MLVVSAARTYGPAQRHKRQQEQFILWARYGETESYQRDTEPPGAREAIPEGSHLTAHDVDRPGPRWPVGDHVILSLVVAWLSAPSDL